MSRPGRQAIPIADLRSLIDPVRRTAVVRWALAAGLVVAVTAAALVAQRPASSEITLAQGGRSGVVVLDMSASIGSARRRITEPFEYLADTGQGFGLILFSGTAYEAAPSVHLAPAQRRRPSAPAPRAAGAQRRRMPPRPA